MNDTRRNAVIQALQLQRNNNADSVVGLTGELAEVNEKLESVTHMFNAHETEVINLRSKIQELVLELDMLNSMNKSLRENKDKSAKLEVVDVVDLLTQNIESLPDALTKNSPAIHTLTV